MVRAKSLPLTNAPSLACSLLLNGQAVNVTGVSRKAWIGIVTRHVCDGPMIILHRSGHCIGFVEFTKDFDHIRVRGSTESFSLDDVILIRFHNKTSKYAVFCSIDTTKAGEAMIEE